MCSAEMRTCGMQDRRLVCRYRTQKSRVAMLVLQNLIQKHIRPDDRSLNKIATCFSNPIKLKFISPQISSALSLECLNALYHINTAYLMTKDKFIDDPAFQEWSTWHWCEWLSPKFLTARKYLSRVFKGNMTYKNLVWLSIRSRMSWTSKLKANFVMLLWK